MDKIRNDRDLALYLVFAKIDSLLKEKERVILAIDGRSGSGKTTLARAIQEKYGCAVIHMDDFFLRPEQRPPERYAQAGGNVDRERFLDEVLIPLSRGEEPCFRPFDCGKMDFADPVSVNTAGLTVIEGVYSMHPDLAPYYDASIFLTIDGELQKKRITERAPEMAQRYFEEWIPMEEKYFSQLKISEKCDRIIKITEKKQEKR